MIIDVPTGDDFKSAGIDFLNLAWNTLISLSTKLKDAEYFYNVYYSDENEEVIDQLSSEQYWKQAQRPLSTALSLIQQGTEFLLKGHIATVSPYLLILGDPSNYPSKSHERNIRFSEFKTIDAQDLVKVYNTVSTGRLPDNFRQRFEDLRSKRNIIMHTVDPELYIKTENLFVEILEICHYLIEPNSWIKIRGQFIQNEPESVLYSPETRELFNLRLALEINLVIDLLTPSANNKYFNFNKKTRRYFCPSCYSGFRENYEDEQIPRLAQLIPNEPTSNTIYCLVCNESYEVLREDCTAEDCLGNVIDPDDGTCLTCGSDNFRD
ncbi:MAG: hypothetical protein GPJ01_08765 [Microcystis aeruginosa LL13-06]|jgi:hypothetical protein|nr:hypothetical protein [Microcystis aeruginosa LL13-06]